MSLVFILALVTNDVKTYLVEIIISWSLIFYTLTTYHKMFLLNNFYHTITVETS